MMEMKQFPANMGDLEVDLKHPNRVLIDGLYKETVSVKGAERTFLTYIPENLEYCSPCLIAAADSAADPVSFLEENLKAFADRNRLFLFVAYPENGCWNNDGTDADYLNAVYVKIQARDYYITMQDNIYLSAFGDAAFTAHQAARRMASEYSGLMTFGDLSLDLLKDVNVVHGEEDQGQVELKIQGSAAQLPVWMSISTTEGANGSAIEYWKQQNHTVGKPLSGDGADYIWRPDYVRKVNEINEEHISEVRVAVRNELFTEETLNDAWSYIRLARRHRGQGGKCLRYYKDPIACGAVKKTMEVDGMVRTWYEFVPEECRDGKKYPLVVTMHGRGGSAETFFDLSGMSVVAKERKFIAVFPEAGIHQQKKNGLRNVLLWCGEYHGKPIDDVKFIREMVADIESRLPVDHSRIYACGQSSGGMMSDLLGYTAADLFAAVAPWSALRSPSRMYADFEESEFYAPTMWIYGDKDFLCAAKGTDPELPFAIEPEIRQTLADKLQHFRLDIHKQDTWTTEPITWCGFRNEAGVPLVVIGRVSDMIHANYPELSWISYDQFLSQFTKDENGEVYFRGHKVER
ncbi:MAG: PHB depolymerase family esterase [Erysipelotrichaceae bacterium]|nr:PHB depolymerase family esterase [Erysipelotrichaceae bacterium]